MKLLFSPTSPYVRKVRIVAIEKGLAGRVELVPANPWTDLPAVIARNPLGKVPALVDDDGNVYYDSPVICEYLDSLVPGNPLTPHSGLARFEVLRRQALADGILDAAVAVVLERRRPPGERSPEAERRALDAIRRALDVVARELAPADAPFDLAQISFAVAIGYLEFRLPELAATREKPVLGAFWDAIVTRPSVAATHPA
jgi:glutathione S-transferase